MICRGMFVARDVRREADGGYTMIGVHDEWGVEPPAGVDPSQIDLMCHVPRAFVIAFLEIATSDPADHHLTLPVVTERGAPWADAQGHTLRVVRTGSDRPQRVIEQFEITDLPLRVPGNYRFILMANGRPLAEIPYYTSRTTAQRG